MFLSRSKSKLGIDIGTSSIKVVQLKKEKEQYFLETYGVVSISHQVAGKMEFDVIGETAAILRQLLIKSQVGTKKVVASLPNNMVFVSVVEMPTMSDKELQDAINWEARRYVPLPIEEVTLSCSVLEEEEAGGQIKVLLTAVPTTVIDNYLKLFKLAGLEPQALEIEALALIRSLVGSSKESFIIIDVGARNTCLNLVDKGFLRVSRNLAVGGEAITQAIAHSLHVSFARAEQFKRDLGVSGGLREIPQTIRPVIETIKDGTGQLIKIFESNGGTIQEIILAGSASYLPGFLDYFSDLGPKIALGDPLKFVSYDSRLNKILPQVSLDLSVALGLAMRE